MVDLLRTIKNALDAHGALIFGGAVAAGLVARRASLKRSSFDADWSYVTCFGCGRGGYSDEMASTTDDSGKDHYSCARCARPDLFRQAEADESFEDFRRRMVGDAAIAGDMGYMEALEEYYQDYLEEFESGQKEMCPDPKTFEQFQEMVLNNDYEEGFAAEGTNPGKWFFLSSYDYLWLGVIPHEAMEPNHGSVKLEREDFQELEDADLFDIDQVYFDRDWFQHYYGHDRIFDPLSGDEFRIGAPGAHIEDYGPIVPMLIRVTDPNTIQILVDGGCKAFDNPPQTKADWSMGDGVVEIDGVAYSISDDNYAAEEDSNNPCPHCEGAAGFPREFYYQSDRIDMVPCGTCLTQGRCPGCMEIYADLTRDNTPEDVFYGSGCTSCGYSESDAREARKTARRWVDLIDNPAATRFMDAEDYGVGSVWMAERYDPAKHAKPLPIGSVRRFLSTIPQRQHFRIEFVKSSGHIRSMDAILTKPFAGGDVASVLEIFPGSEKSSVFKRFRLDRVISIYRV